MEKVVVMIIITIISIVIGFQLYSQFTSSVNQTSELSMERRAILAVEKSVQNMFYQPNSAIDVVHIPENVFLRVYSEDNTLIIESENFKEEVPNVDIIKPVIIDKSTIIIKRISFDNTTNTLIIEITN